MSEDIERVDEQLVEKAAKAIRKQFIRHGMPLPEDATVRAFAAAAIQATEAGIAAHKLKHRVEELEHAIRIMMCATGSGGLKFSTPEWEGFFDKSRQEAKAILSKYTYKINND